MYKVIEFKFKIILNSKLMWIGTLYIIYYDDKSIKNLYVVYF